MKYSSWNRESHSCIIGIHNDVNPSSTDKYWNQVPGIQNPDLFPLNLKKIFFFIVVNHTHPNRQTIQSIPLYSQHIPLVGPGTNPWVTDAS